MATLIVEDGTGLVNANTYASLQDFKAFADDNGIIYTQFSDEVLSVYLVKGTNFLDSFETQFVGKRFSPKQSLSFPRVCKSSASHLYDTRALIKALFYSVEVQCLGLNLLPTNFSRDDYIKKEKIDTLEIQYSEDLIANNLIGKFPIIERYMSGYFFSRAGNPSVSR